MPRPRSARPRSASRSWRSDAGVACIAVGGGVEPEGIEALRPFDTVVVGVVERPQSVEEAMAAGVEPVRRCGERLARLVSLGPPDGPRSRAMTAELRRTGSRSRAGPPRHAAAKAATKRKPARRKTKRRKPNPYTAWAKGLERRRPGLVRFTLDGVATLYGHPQWERRWDPTSELILTILTQNSADVNAEHAFIELRKAYPSGRPAQRHVPGPGWGGVGLPEGIPPDWALVDAAPLEELVEVIRPGGLPNQKAKAHQGRPPLDPRGARRLLPRVPRRDDGARSPRPG